MPYATAAHVVDWYGEARLSAAVPETGSTLLQQVEKALLSAGAKIDGVLQRVGFPVPVDTSGSEQLAALLEECATVFAIRSVLRSKSPEAINALAKECMEMLRGLDAGTFGLAGTAAPARRAFFPVLTGEADRPEITAAGLARDATLLGC